MAILPYQEIRKRIKDDELIVNADVDNCLGPASYELRIGSIRSIEGKDERKLEKGQEFVMKSGASILIGTMEEVNLSDDIAGFLFLKSSLGRAGYIPWSQGYVDRGYKGALTIALHNFAGNLRLFEGHQKICHLVLVKLTANTTNPYEGEYSGSKGATASKEKTPIVIGPSGIQMFSKILETAGDETLRTIVGNGVRSILGDKT